MWQWSPWLEERAWVLEHGPEIAFPVLVTLLPANRGVLALEATGRRAVQTPLSIFH